MTTMNDDIPLIADGVIRKKIHDDRRKDVLEFYIKDFYENFRHYFDSGDLTFTGGIIHNITGLNKKDSFGDLDMSVIKGPGGDKVLNELREYLENEDFLIDGYVAETKSANGDVFAYINRYVSIDFFRNDHPKELTQEIEVRPGVFTKYFGHKWIYDATRKLYKTWEEIEPKSDSLKEVMFKMNILLKNIESNIKIEK